MSDYVIDPAWGQERARLALLEEWTDPMTERRLRALGVGEGWHCLEAGAGSGSVARWLGGEVGTSGRVLAVDVDTRFLDAAPDDRVEVLRADLLADELPESAFDLVHARALIHHLEDPAAGLRRLARCLRPGGLLLVEEPDCFAGLASMHEGWRAAWEALRHLPALDISYGRRLIHDVRDLGLQEVEAEIEVHMVRGGTRLARFHALSLEALRGPAVAAGLITEQAVDALITELDDPALLEPSFTWVAVSGRA